MNRFVKLGTVAAAIVGGLVTLAWLIKDRLIGSAPSEPVAAPEPRPVHAPTPEPAPAPEPAGDDDLSVINGIGPVYKSRLSDLGITSFAALAAADAAGISEAVGAPVSRIQAWVDAARRRS